MDGPGRTVRQLAPHYLILVAVILATITVLDILVPGVSIITQLLLALAIAMLYPIALKKVGRAPEPWK